MNRRVLWALVSLFALLGAEFALAAEEPVIEEEAVEDSCAAPAEQQPAGEIDGIVYSHLVICSCTTNADCDDVCGEEGGVCRELNTVPCPPPHAGSCLCGAEEAEPRQIPTSP